jgi:hypothetical protein
MKFHQEAAWLFCNGDDRTGTGAFHHYLLDHGKMHCCGEGPVGTPHRAVGRAAASCFATVM